MSDRGVYRLAGAVLLQAILDATSSSHGRRASALRWMSGKGESCFSFAFVCRVVNRNPDEVRRFCASRAAQRRMPELCFRAPLNPPQAAEGLEYPAWQLGENPLLASPPAA